MPSLPRTLLKAAGVTATGLFVGRALLRKSRHFSYAGKRVLITGGSRGLGLVLARALTDAGALVALCARDAAELLRAANDIEQHGRRPITFVCDIRDDAHVASTMAAVVDALGSIDILFNVAGIINVGPLAAMTMSDFENAMQTNCWGALRTTRAALPHMKKQGWGRVVNIASLGGKRAVPHMLPYTASKFAMVGLSTGLRTELAQDGVLVTTICPGLMRTGSPRNASFKGQTAKEFAWFSVGDSLPLLSMSAERAAQQITKSCQRGDAEVTLSGAGQLLAAVQTVAPNLTSEVLTLVDRLLPANGGDGSAKKGSESPSWLSPSWLTTLGDTAAARNNEVTRL